MSAGRHKQFEIRKVVAATIVAATMLLTGCSDFFANKPTEVQAMTLLDELSEVRESPKAGNVLPDIYLQQPSRLEIKGGTKLFYYTKHHSVADLAVLVKEQLEVEAAVNTATNQMVIYCQDNTQADIVQNYLAMVDVPPVQVNIDCLILERFANITTDWETSLLIQNFLGESIAIGEDRATFVNVKKTGLDTYRLVDKAGNEVGASNISPALFPSYDLSGLEVGQTAQIVTNLDPAFPGASIREVERAKFGLDFGYWINEGVPGHQVRGVVDMLVSHGYLKALLNPTLETVNGQKATVTIKDYAPIEEVRTSQGGDSSVYNITQYVWVENTLTVTPFVYSDGSIGLTTDILIGSRSKPEGIVQRAIITERSINVAENRILPGESLVIGGMRKSEKRAVIRGVPFFKDLPLVGILFSSKDYEEKGTEIIFVLTPSISSGGRDNTKVVQDIRVKHADPEFKMGLYDILTEAFDSGVYGEMVEKQAAAAELKRAEAEFNLEQAIQRAQMEKDLADAAAAEAEAFRIKAEQMNLEISKAAEQAKKAAEEAAAATTLTVAERAQAAQLQQEKDKVQASAQQAQQQAAEAAQKAIQAAEMAQQAQQQLQQAKDTAEKAALEAERARAEAKQKAIERQAARQREIERQKEIQRQQERERQEKARLEAEKPVDQEAAPNPLSSGETHPETESSQQAPNQ